MFMFKAAEQCVQYKTPFGSNKKKNNITVTAQLFCFVPADSDYPLYEDVVHVAAFFVHLWGVFYVRVTVKKNETEEDVEHVEQIRFFSSE